MNFKKYFNFQKDSITYGLTDELTSFYVKELQKEHNENIILLTSNLYEANKLYNTIKQNQDNVLLFPMDDFIASKVVAISPEFELQRLQVLDNLNGSQKYIIITDLMGYLKYLPDKNKQNSINISINDLCKRDELIDNLNNLGYKRESMVFVTGEYSLRGFIVDIYPTNEEHPVRIEFDGELVESIRYFDENTQRTISDITEINIKNFKEINTNLKNSLYDYTNNGIVIYYNKNQIDVVYKKLVEEILEYVLSLTYGNENAIIYV